MYTLYKFHFLNGISEINQLFDDILIIWPAPVYIYMNMGVWLSVMLESFFILKPFVVLIFWIVFSSIYFIWMFSFEMLLYAFVILFNFSIFLNVYI